MYKTSPKQKVVREKLQSQKPPKSLRFPKMKFTLLFFLASATLAIATSEIQTQPRIQARDPRIDLERMVIRSDDSGKELPCTPCCTPICTMYGIPCNSCSCCIEG